MTICYYESVFHALYNQYTADNIIKKIDCEIKQKGNNQMRNIYQVITEDETVYVLAESFNQAIEKWRLWLADFNESDIADYAEEEPNSVVLIARSDQIVG